MKKHFWKIFAALAVVALVGSFVIANQAANEANEGITFEPHVKGNPDASVTLVEYSDFQCPACGQAFPVVQALLEEYGDDVRFEYKHFPLFTIHPQAVPAARAAEAAGQQGKFWEMHDLLFENQSVWSNSANPALAFNQYAEEIGLDMGQFRTHLGASLIDDRIMEQVREAQRKGYTGTPTFELNGERMQFSSYQDFIDQIAAATGRTTTEETAEENASSTETSTDAGSNVRFGI